MDMVTKYFKHLLFFFSGPEFHDDQVQFPTAYTPISDYILQVPCFCFFFF
ncbi:hypothetical protein ID866_11917 [Astraeus odoratus]|nr:hypothetical protein ID866_11917 [Astraeus odoratus]